MKIKEFIDWLGEKYEFQLKIVKKWIFWILLDLDAFFMSKTFHLKLTVLDKSTIKVWFPDLSKDKWLKLFQEKGIWYILFEKQNSTYIETARFLSNNYCVYFSIDLDDYNLTKNRVLWLNKLWIEDKSEKNFLLKDKAEDIYIQFVSFVLTFSKKERYFFREKLERLFLDLFEYIYKYMYNLWDRKELIEIIFNKVMILREFYRLLYKIWKVKNHNIYLELWGKWIELLKICKWIKSKNV
jgi:hypothetical protein